MHAEAEATENKDERPADGGKRSYLRQMLTKAVRSTQGGGSHNWSILVAMCTVGVLSVLSRGASLALDIVVAPRFGLGDTLDAYYLAALVPVVAVTIVGGSLNAALIPIYIQKRTRDGRAVAQRLVSNVVFWNTAILVLVSILFAVFIPGVLRELARNASPAKAELAEKLFYALLPLVVLSGLTTSWGALLNAEKQFALAAISPAITPIVVIILLCLPGVSWGIYTLAYGAVLGAVLELTLLGVALRRVGVSLLPRCDYPDAALREVMHQYGPMVAGAFLMSGTSVVNQGMAASLGTGSISAYNYGTKVVMWIVGFGALTVGTAVMPHFADMVAHQSWSAVRHTLRVYLKLILVATIPATIVFMLLSTFVIRMLFERNAFTENDTQTVAAVQTLAAIQIPFYVASMLVVRLISCLRGNHILMWGAALNLFLNIGLVYLLTPAMGVTGIALTNSCVITFSFVFTAVMLRIRMRAMATD